MALNTTTYSFDVDMIPNGYTPVVHVSQGDVGRPFVANLYWNGVSWTAGSGVTCNLRGQKPDKTVFDYSATISGTTATFSTTQQMTIIDGKVECELVFVSGSTTIATANFDMLVEKSPYNASAPSTSDISGIGTSSLEDGAVTKAKLATAVQNQMDTSTSDIAALKTRVTNVENSMYLAIDNDGYISLG